MVRAKDSNCTSLPSNSSVIYMGMLQTPKNIGLVIKEVIFIIYCFFPRSVLTPKSDCLCEL